MILSDGEIKTALTSKTIIIKPIPQELQYSPSSVDLYLGDELFELKTLEDLKKDEPTGVERPIIVDPITVKTRDLFRKYAKNLARETDGSFIVEPGKFVLGITQEYVDLPRRSKIAARVEGRSTLARLGLIVHFTAPTIHSSFRGHIILEMYNLGNYPLRLFPGKLRICQLIFERLGRIPKTSIKTPYLNQKSPR